MKLTTQQRLDGYRYALCVLETSIKHSDMEMFSGVCKILNSYMNQASLKPKDILMQTEVSFPEFNKYKPKEDKMFWWPIGLQGTIMRMVALKECIASCETQLLIEQKKALRTAILLRVLEEGLFFGSLILLFSRFPLMRGAGVLWLVVSLGLAHSRTKKKSP